MLYIKKMMIISAVTVLPPLIFVALFGRCIPSISVNAAENRNGKNILYISEDIYYRQTFNNCAPYSAMAAVNVITKRELDPEVLAKETAWRIKNNLTFPQGLIDLLHRHGIKTKEYILYPLGKTEKINWIKNTIDEGRPIILLIKTKNVLHYVTVIGYDEKGFILYDSLQDKTQTNPRKTVKDRAEYPGNRYYPYGTLLTLWDGGGYKIFFKNWALVCF